MHVAGKVDCTQLTARLCPPDTIKTHFQAKNCMSQMKLMNMGADCCTEMGHISITFYVRPSYMQSMHTFLHTKPAGQQKYDDVDWKNGAHVGKM